MGKVFTRHKRGPEGSDCTAPYSVTLHKACTAREFIGAVLKHNTEWGSVSVTRAGMTLAAVTDMQNAMYGVMDEPDPLKGLTRNKRRLAMNTGAGVCLNRSS